MDIVVLVTVIGLWLLLVAAAAIVPLIGSAGADRNADLRSLPRRHDDTSGGTRAA